MRPAYHDVYAFFTKPSCNLDSTARLRYVDTDSHEICRHIEINVLHDFIAKSERGSFRKICGDRCYSSGGCDSERSGKSCAAGFRGGASVIIRCRRDQVDDLVTYPTPNLHQNPSARLRFGANLALPRGNVNRLSLGLYRVTRRKMFALGGNRPKSASNADSLGLSHPEAMWAGSLPKPTIAQVGLQPFADSDASQSTISSRMTNFCGLPVMVIGSSDTIRTCRGTLKCAIWPEQ